MLWWAKMPYLSRHCDWSGQRRLYATRTHEVIVSIVSKYLVSFVEAHPDVFQYIAGTEGDVLTNLVPEAQQLSSSVRDDSIDKVRLFWRKVRTVPGLSSLPAVDTRKNQGERR
jgi:hypothetical protein